jgi:hypothetical protein
MNSVLSIIVFQSQSSSSSSSSSSHELKNRKIVGVGHTSVKQYLQEVIRLLTPDGVFICISHANPEQRLIYLEQYDLELPGFTPWTVEVLAMQKPLQHKGEILPADEPDSYYFIYICKISDELKKKQENKISKDAQRSKRKMNKKKAPAL